MNTLFSCVVTQTVLGLLAKIHLVSAKRPDPPWCFWCRDYPILFWSIVGTSALIVTIGTIMGIYMSIRYCHYRPNLTIEPPPPRYLHPKCQIANGYGVPKVRC